MSIPVDIQAAFDAHPAPVRPPAPRPQRPSVWAPPKTARPPYSPIANRV